MKGLCNVDNVRLYGDRIPTLSPTDKATINPSITPTIHPMVRFFVGLIIVLKNVV